MTAAVLHGRRDLRIESMPRPGAPGPDEVVIAVQSVGLCGTDVAEWEAGPIQVPLIEAHPVTGHCGPTVLGHEISGTVVEIGINVSPDWDGELVACAGAVHCERCPACQEGQTSQCTDYSVVGLHRHGGLAPLVCVPVRSCARADGLGLTADEVALAQPMAIAVHAARRGAPQRSERAVVLGAGGIGACLVYILSSWGVAVTAVDIDPARLRIAGELGARKTLSFENQLAVADLVEAHGEQPTLIYEATGVPASLQVALTSASIGARIVSVGMQKHPAELDVRRLTLREQQLVGTNSLVVATDLPEALQLLALRAGRWDIVAPQVIPLSDVVASGLRRPTDGRSSVIKTLVNPRAKQRRSLYSASE